MIYLLLHDGNRAQTFHILLIYNDMKSLQVIER